MALVFILAVTTGTVVSIVLFSRHLLPGAARVRDARADKAGRSPGRSSGAFFVVTPVQYFADLACSWYGLFSILIPVYVSMFLAIRTVLAGDTDAISRAHRHEPVGTHDLRLLRELRAGAADAADPGYERADARS